MAVKKRMSWLLAAALLATPAIPSLTMAQQFDSGVTMAPPTTGNSMIGGGAMGLSATPPGFTGGGWQTGMGINNGGWNNNLMNPNMLNQQTWQNQMPQQQMDQQQSMPSGQNQMVPSAPLPPNGAATAQNNVPGTANPTAAPNPGGQQGGRIIRDGDVVRGMGIARSGSVVSVEGLTLPLIGLSAPEPGSHCDDGRGGSWQCGNRAQQILQNILDRGIVSCSYTSVPSPGLRCTQARDDVGRIAALDGAAASTTTDYLAYSAEARSDFRGIWAKASPMSRPVRHRNTSR